MMDFRWNTICFECERFHVILNSTENAHPVKSVEYQEQRWAIGVDFTYLFVDLFAKENQQKNNQSKNSEDLMQLSTKDMFSV